MIPPDDYFYCPRRVTDSLVPLPDYWSGGYWADWPEAWGPAPRICSHCRSVHPEDVSRLLDLGWEIERTRSGERVYIQPPGTLLANHRLAKAYGTGSEAAVAAANLAFPWMPSPPLMFLSVHAEGDLLQRL